MKHYEIKLSFQTYRDLTLKETTQLINNLLLQIEEPTNSDQEDEDYETKIINYSIEDFDVNPKCCEHDFESACACCMAECDNCLEAQWRAIAHPLRGGRWHSPKSGEWEG